MNTLPPDIVSWERRNTRATYYAIGAAVLTLILTEGAAWAALGSLS